MIGRDPVCLSSRAQSDLGLPSHFQQAGAYGWPACLSPAGVTAGPRRHHCQAVTIPNRFFCSDLMGMRRAGCGASADRGRTERHARLGYPSGISRFPTHRETPLAVSRVEPWTQSILNPIHPHELPAAVDGTPNVTTFEYTEHINPFTGKPSRTWPLGKSRTNGATDPEAVGQSPPLH